MWTNNSSLTAFDETRFKGPTCGNGSQDVQGSCSESKNVENTIWFLAVHLIRCEFVLV